jgi:AraC-like DNA-binding protein
MMADVGDVRLPLRDSGLVETCQTAIGAIRQEGLSQAMAEILSTETVTPRHALAYWTDLICNVYVGLDCETEHRGDFRSQLTRFPLPALKLSEVRGSPQQVKRSPRRLSSAPSDDFLINLQLAGRSKVIQDGRVAEIGPGDMAMYDASRPYVLAMDDDFDMVVFQLPRDLLRQRLVGPEHLTARTVQGSTGFGRAASRFLMTAPAAVETGDLGGALIEGHVLDLLATLFGALPDASALTDRRSARLVAAKDMIERLLDEPDLDRETIARAVGLSVRELARVFALENETPAGYVRRRRLERCRADLAAPRLAARTITDIALSHGFNDAAHFSRLFKESFGVSPADYRASAKTGRGRN